MKIYVFSSRNSSFDPETIFLFQNLSFELETQDFFPSNSSFYLQTLAFYQIIICSKWPFEFVCYFVNSQRCLVVQNLGLDIDINILGIPDFH